MILKNRTRKDKYVFLGKFVTFTVFILFIPGLFISDFYYFDRYGIGLSDPFKGGIISLSRNIETNENSGGCRIVVYYKILSLVFSEAESKDLGNC